MDDLLQRAFEQYRCELIRRHPGRLQNLERTQAEMGPAEFERRKARLERIGERLREERPSDTTCPECFFENEGRVGTMRSIPADPDRPTVDTIKCRDCGYTFSSDDDMPRARPPRSRP